MNLGYTLSSAPRVRRTVIPVYGREAKLVLERAILPLYTTRYLYDIVKAPSTVYYRVYRNRAGEYAVLLVYEWPYQYIPPHMNDYEPVVVILDRNMKVKEVYVDGFHYYVDKAKRPLLPGVKPRLVVKTPWRSMTVKWGPPGGDEVMIYPIDEVARMFPNTRVRYLSEQVLRELKSRENPITLSDRIIYNPFSVRYARHWATYHEPGLDDHLRDMAKNYGTTVSRLTQLLSRVKLLAARLLSQFRVLFPDSIRNKKTTSASEEEVSYA